MTKPTKLAHALVSYYVKRSGQTLNRYKSVWAAQTLLEDFQYDELCTAIDFFVKVQPYPTWEKFTYGAAELLDGVRDDERDRLLRQRQRQLTLELVANDKS